MRGLGLAVMVIMPLLLAACGDDSEKVPAAAITPPAQVQPAPAVPDPVGTVPLRLTPEGLLAPVASAPPAAPAPGPWAARPRGRTWGSGSGPARTRRCARMRSARSITAPSRWPKRI